ncbi:MAG: AbaSI family restriction endonuclease [Candidatus Scatovivens sp.]
MKDKKDYLIKTLSRTKRKDFENYVINRLYTRLNDLDIKPMTQKYVKRKIGGKLGYSLIDLYFPQFNIGIECDEPHHILQEEQDKLRTEDIIAELGNYTEKRIKVFNNSIIDINNDIDKVVNDIKVNKEKQIQNNTFKKWELLTPQEYFANKDKITIYDDIEFSTINETSNLIFGTNYKGQQKAWFPIKTIKDKNIMAWFPQLAIEKDNVMVASSNGWNNTINDNKDTIFEYNEFSTNTSNDFDKRERVTFMKMKDKITNKSSYKFLGVFLPISKINGKVTYKRIATEFKIIKN